jgi:hypothetical protein
MHTTLAVQASKASTISRTENPMERHVGVQSCPGNVQGIAKSTSKYLWIIEKVYGLLSAQQYNNLFQQINTSHEELQQNRVKKR